MDGEDIKAMTERHGREIEALREACPHKEVSEWMPYMWAPGHYSGAVRACKWCGKIIEERPLTGPVFDV